MSCDPVQFTVDSAYLVEAAASSSEEESLQKERTSNQQWRTDDLAEVCLKLRHSPLHIFDRIAIKRPEESGVRCPKAILRWYALVSSSRVNDSQEFCCLSSLLKMLSHPADDVDHRCRLANQGSDLEEHHEPLVLPRTERLPKDIRQSATGRR